MTEVAGRALARAEIRELLDLYHAAVNYRDWTLLPRIFTETAIWDAPPPIGARFSGLAELARGFAESVGRQELLVQSSSGVLIDFVSTTEALVRSTMVELGREPDKAAWTAVVRFEDTAVLTQAGWRIAARKVLVDHVLLAAAPSGGKGASLLR